MTDDPAGAAGGSLGTGARGQLGRLLTLVPFLASRDEVRLDQAAAALGTTPRQLVRDLKVLLMCGLPGGYPDDLIDVDLDALEGPDADGVVRVSNADYLSRPLRLSATEATAVIVALRALREGADQATRAVVDRALVKLETAAAEGSAATRVDPGADPAEAGVARLAARLQDAADRGRQVRLRYYVPSRDEESERDVDPRGVVTHAGVPYLDAFCHSAEAPRLFRLDRVGAAEVLDRAVTTAPGPPRDLSGGLFTGADEGGPAPTLTLLLDPVVQWVVEYYPVEEVLTRPDGRLQVRLVVADRRWLTRFLLRLAPHAEVVDEPGLARDAAADLTATAQHALDLYAAPGDVG